MLGKCYWKMFQTPDDELDSNDRKARVSTKTVIEVLKKAIQVAYDARKSRSSDQSWSLTTRSYQYCTRWLCVAILQHPRQPQPLQSNRLASRSIRMTTLPRFPNQRTGKSILLEI